MTVAYPWSGRDVNGRVPLSGRAAVHVPSGAGFNWRSVAQHSSGWVMPRGLRGLGQVDFGTPPTVDTSGSTASVDWSTVLAGAATPTSGSSTTTLNLPGYTTLPTQTTTPATSSSQAPWWAPLVAAGMATGQAITNYQLNPLLQKQTYVSTPQGLIYATNQPTSGIPGLTTTTGSILPLLLIGGVGLMLVMGMARR